MRLLFFANLILLAAGSILAVIILGKSGFVSFSLGVLVFFLDFLAIKLGSKKLVDFVVSRGEIDGPAIKSRRYLVAFNFFLLFKLVALLIAVFVAVVVLKVEPIAFFAGVLASLLVCFGLEIKSYLQGEESKG